MIVPVIVTIADCSASNPSLTTGMKMQEAVSTMKQRGLDPQQMAYSIDHNAFDLPDGRTVVLIGSKTVDEIQIIVNPEDPKSQRSTEILTRLVF